jgi:hypothetical protein
MQEPLYILKWLFGVASLTAVGAYLFCVAIGAKRKLTNREMLFLFGIAFGMGLLLWLLDFAYGSVQSLLARL